MSVRFRDAYIMSTREVLNSLIGTTWPHHLAYLGTKHSAESSLSTSMDHLSCFYPGMLALGIMNNVMPETSSIAKNLTHTCYYMYNITSPTHLAPEIFRLNVRPGGSEDAIRSSVSKTNNELYLHGSFLVHNQIIHALLKYVVHGWESMSLFAPNHKGLCKVCLFVLSLMKRKVLKLLTFTYFIFRIPRTYSDQRLLNRSFTSTDLLMKKSIDTGHGRSSKHSETPLNSREPDILLLPPCMSPSNTRIGWRAFSCLKH